MHLKHTTKRAAAMVLILSLLMSLSACAIPDAIDSAAQQIGISTAIEPGVRLIDSSWINSDLEGSIDENTQLNLKDDFHTTVNRDWFLENNAVGNEEISTFTPVRKTLEENQIRLLTPGAKYNPDPNIMSSETLDHLQNLIWDMMDLAGNQKKRNELGVEPLRPYLKAIEQIDSMEDMTEYLINANCMNFTGENLVNFTVGSPANTRDYYTVHIGSPDHCILLNFTNYYGLSDDAHIIYKKNVAALEHVLGQLGYTPAQIKQLILNCHAFESKLASLVPDVDNKNDPDYRDDRGDEIYTLEDIQKLQGNFPLTDLLEASGIAHSDTFRVYEPALVRYMGKYYTEKHLENLKAYFMVHTVLDSLLYLDETCQTMGQDISNRIQNYVLTENPADLAKLSEKDYPEQAAQIQLFNNYIIPLLYEPFQLTYVGNYCSSEAKADILNTLEEIRSFYVDLLANTEWLSLQTREKAVEKMEKMEFRVMYPDILPDYSGLDYRNYDEGGNLIDAVAAIRMQKKAPASKKINQPVKRTDWDLDEMSTLVVNAYNDLDTNSIVILCGIMADGFMYHVDAPMEQNYGRLGVILGHEVTHAFDTKGYTRDAEGITYGWWTNDDEVAFRLRSTRLANHYTALNTMPGYATNYDGQLVQTEAISDMGGIKCMLALAEDIPDFDYDLFFRSFASTWRMQTSFSIELQKTNDEHPLGFLRTNVTLQQFDKFYETYDIGPGDGMYLAPEDRILVW